MLADLMNRTCSVVRRYPSGTEDDYGNEIPGETTTVTVCEFQQRQRSEDEEVVSEEQWLVILPAATNIDTADVLIVDEVEYELVGQPWPARNPRTKEVSHIEATVVRTSGAFDGGQS